MIALTKDSDFGPSGRAKHRRVASIRISQTSLRNRLHGLAPGGGVPIVCRESRSPPRLAFSAPGEQDAAIWIKPAKRRDASRPRGPDADFNIAHAGRSWPLSFASVASQAVTTAPTRRIVSERLLPAWPPK